ncbi:rhodanese-related sulfurtransferase [Psychromonas sp. CNPT3]|uniref:oxygen-dependent tRNA uridine(34) hydroxylase TrhO n=1 Tax=Psychromonas sp. CNPT3 TaxID=314282 RepID=UPI0002C05FB0|nr:rhodanese-related sulfurtransferase [Psychromonas sp. CNPT3]AGH81171.1 rhodanese-related sulfurtransferase [Psychromonas sp. CNPT3]
MSVKITVCALYKFVRLETFEALRAPLLQKMQSQDVRGTLLLAAEGINGTIAGPQKGIDAVLSFLSLYPNLEEISFKQSYHDENPFLRTKVKLKKEIVTLGVEGIDPNQVVGTYVKPKDWNALISDPDVTLIDTRNDYEIEIGTFQNAVNPHTTTFREFPEYVKNNLDKNKHKKVAMYCTGGIRCEKSTAYLKEQGFSEVYHLEGGILKYLEEVKKEESMWEGECFVFDARVSVDHDLKQGQCGQCYACRYPLTQDEMQSPHYVKGLSCHRCHDQVTDIQRNRFAERERQMGLAEKRGEAHIGGAVKQVINERRAEKAQKKAQQNVK